MSSGKRKHEDALRIDDDGSIECSRMESRYLVDLHGLDRRKNDCSESSQARASSAWFETNDSAVPTQGEEKNPYDDGKEQEKQPESIDELKKLITTLKRRLQDTKDRNSRAYEVCMKWQRKYTTLNSKYTRLSEKYKRLHEQCHRSNNRTQNESQRSERTFESRADEAVVDLTETQTRQPRQALDSTAIVEDARGGLTSDAIDLRSSPLHAGYKRSYPQASALSREREKERQIQKEKEREREGRQRRQQQQRQDEEAASLALARHLQLEEERHLWTNPFTLYSSGRLDDDHNFLNRRLTSSNHAVNPDDMSYEELLALGDRMGDVSKDRWKRQAASVLARLPSFNYSHSLKAQESTCIICQSEYADKDCVRCLPCLHTFHKDCVDPWLRENNSCPICKSKIDDGSE